MFELEKDIKENSPFRSPFWVRWAAKIVAKHLYKKNRDNIHIIGNLQWFVQRDFNGPVLTAIEKDSFNDVSVNTSIPMTGFVYWILKYCGYDVSEHDVMEWIGESQRLEENMVDDNDIESIDPRTHIKHIETFHDKIIFEINNKRFTIKWNAKIKWGYKKYKTEKQVLEGYMKHYSIVLKKKLKNNRYTKYSYKAALERIEKVVKSHAKTDFESNQTEGGLRG